MEDKNGDTTYMRYDDDKLDTLEFCNYCDAVRSVITTSLVFAFLFTLAGIWFSYQRMNNDSLFNKGMGIFIAWSSFVFTIMAGGTGINACMSKINDELEVEAMAQTSALIVITSLMMLVALGVNLAKDSAAASNAEGEGDYDSRA